MIERLREAAYNGEGGEGDVHKRDGNGERACGMRTRAMTGEDITSRVTMRRGLMAC